MTTYPGDPGDDDLEESGEHAEAMETVEAEEQLPLADEDERLPWLESDDEHEDEGVDTARIVMVALIGLVVIGALLAMGWYLTRAGSDPGILADGSTIEAPDAPYKQRPAEPGGTEVAGTGDVSYEVGEGQQRRSTLAEAEDQTPRPSIDREQTGEDAPAAASGVGVQVGAFSNRADAERGWTTFAQRFEAVSGMSHRIVEATVDGAKVYRLQAIAPDRTAADATCRAIRNSGGDCYVRD